MNKVKQSLEEFFKKFGKNTTSNFQLMKFGKELKIPNLKVLMRDELGEVNFKNDRANVIVNLHKSNERGVHWSAIYINKDKRYFFDSYALPPTDEVKKFMKHGEFSEFELQRYNDKYCGQLCLLVLDKLNKGDDFHEIILTLKNEFDSFG
jgi:hypothetical protein